MIIADTIKSIATAFEPYPFVSMIPPAVNAAIVYKIRNTTISLQINTVFLDCFVFGIIFVASSIQTLMKNSIKNSITQLPIYPQTNINYDILFLHIFRGAFLQDQRIVFSYAHGFRHLWQTIYRYAFHIRKPNGCTIYNFRRVHQIRLQTV